MKTRFIALILVFLGAIGVYAQNDPSLWIDPGTGIYSDRTIIYLKVGADNDIPIKGDKIAAFIDGQCRGVYEFTGNNTEISTDPDYPNFLTFELATLEVRSNLDEVQKEISFKLLRWGGVYDVMPITKDPVLANLGTYGEPSHPLNVTMPKVPSQVKLRLKEGKVLKVRVGEQPFDVTDKLYIDLTPKDAQLPLNYEWESGKYYTMNGNFITGLIPTGEGTTDWLILRSPKFTMETNAYISSNTIPVEVLPEAVPVSGIILRAPLGEIVTDINDPVKIEFDVEPANATNKNVVTFLDKGNLEFGTVSPSDLGNGEFMMMVTPRAVGNHAFNIVSESDKNVVLQINLKAEPKIAFAQQNAIYKVGEKYRIPKLIIDPENTKIDWSLATMDIQQKDISQPSNFYRWKVAEVGNDEIGPYFIPRVICQDFELYLKVSENKNSLVQTINFEKDYTYSLGWNWIAVPYRYDFMAYNKNQLIEVRSQNEQVYNDPQYGWFGDIFEFCPGMGYKHNAKSEVTFNVAYVPQEAPVKETWLEPNWNWIGVPYEYDYSWAYLEKYPILPSNEGDILMSKEQGFMTYTQDKRWVASGEMFPLESGKGYLYKLMGSQSQAIDWQEKFSIPQPALPVAPAPVQEKHPDFIQHQWQYDGSRFASAMAIIGKLTLQPGDNTQQYSVGAFVNNECRGEGRIYNNGLVLVSLNGESGETVSFKLLDKITGEITDFSTMVSFDLQSGSVQHPIPMSLKNEATGIDNIKGDNLNIRFVGNGLKVDGGYPYQVVAADGKVVDSRQLSTGVYVVIIDTPDGKISRKVVKR